MSRECEPLNRRTKENEHAPSPRRNAGAPGRQGRPPPTGERAKDSIAGMWCRQVPPFGPFRKRPFVSPAWGTRGIPACPSLVVLLRFLYGFGYGFGSRCRHRQVGRLAPQLWDLPCRFPPRLASSLTVRFRSSLTLFASSYLVLLDDRKHRPLGFQGILSNTQTATAPLSPLSPYLSRTLGSLSVSSPQSCCLGMVHVPLAAFA